MKVTGIVCARCHTFIWSRTQCDLRFCSCGLVGIDGGMLSQTRIIGKSNNYKLMEINIPYVTAIQAYIDYSYATDQLGLIKGTLNKRRYTYHDWQN